MNIEAEIRAEKNRIVNDLHDMEERYNGISELSIETRALAAVIERHLSKPKSFVANKGEFNPKWYEKEKPTEECES